MNVSRDTLGIVYIRSDKDTHFTGALVQNAKEDESISFPGEISEIGVRELLITGASIQSDQNLEWDIFLWRNNNFDNTDLDIDGFVDFINFTAASGKQIAGAGQFYYPSSSNMAIPYRVDYPSLSQIHCSLVNRSAAAKNAGATGEIAVEFMVRPVRGI